MVPPLLRDMPVVLRGTAWSAPRDGCTTGWSHERSDCHNRADHLSVTSRPSVACKLAPASAKPCQAEDTDGGEEEPECVGFRNWGQRKYAGRNAGCHCRPEVCASVVVGIMNARVADLQPGACNVRAASGRIEQSIEGDNVRNAAPRKSSRRGDCGEHYLLSVGTIVDRQRDRIHEAEMVIQFLEKDINPQIDAMVAGANPALAAIREGQSPEGKVLPKGRERRFPKGKAAAVSCVCESPSAPVDCANLRI